MSSITPYLPQLAMAWAAYFIAVASPGPAIMAIISASVNSGRSGGMALAMGVMTGSVIWATLAALGLSALLATYGHALIVLKIAGGLYLFYLAYKALKSALAGAALAEGESHAAPADLSRLYWAGLMVHLTNPKAVFVWLALVSLGLPHYAPFWITPFFILVCFAIGAATTIGFALVFSLKPVLAAYHKARRGIEGAMAAFFGFAGFKLITAQF